MTATTRNLCALVRASAAAGRPTATWHLGYGLTSLFRHGYHTDDWLATAELALAIARGNGDRIGEARTDRSPLQEGRGLDLLGDCHIADDPVTALRYWHQALEIYRQLNHPYAALLAEQIARVGAGSPPAQAGEEHAESRHAGG